MKKYIIGLGFLILASICASPAHAMGHGMGGGGMTGNWGSALMDFLQHFQNRDDYERATDQDRREREALDRKYDQETAIMKEQIQRKERKLEGLLKAEDPDIEKIRSLHGELRDLRSQLAEEQRVHNLHARRTNSGTPSEERDDWNPYAPPGNPDSHGMGYGQQMGDNRKR